MYSPNSLQVCSISFWREVGRRCPQHSNKEERIIPPGCWSGSGFRFNWVPDRGSIVPKNSKNSKKKSKKFQKIKIQKNFGKWIVPGDLFSLFLLQFPKGLARTIGFWFWASAASSSLGLFLCSFPLALSAFHSNLSWAMSHSPPGFSMWNLKGSLHHRILALFFFDQRWRFVGGINY